jgi:hypothetical protein
VGGGAVEVKYSDGLGDYPSGGDAIEAAQRWAIQWCDEHSAWAACFDSSKQLLGDSYAALQCLSRISWKAVQRAPTW